MSAADRIIESRFRKRARARSRPRKKFSSAGQAAQARGNRFGLTPERAGTSRKKYVSAADGSLTDTDRQKTLCRAEKPSCAHLSGDRPIPRSKQDEPMVFDLQKRPTPETAQPSSRPDGQRPGGVFRPLPTRDYGSTKAMEICRWTHPSGEETGPDRTRATPRKRRCSPSMRLLARTENDFPVRSGRAGDRPKAQPYDHKPAGGGAMRPSSQFQGDKDMSRIFASAGIFASDEKGPAGGRSR